MFELLQECESHLMGLGFKGGDRGEYIYSHSIKGDYIVTLQESDLGKESLEVLGSVIVHIERVCKVCDNEEVESVWEVLGITVTTLSEFRLLVEGTRTWRFMQLPLYA